MKDLEELYEMIYEQNFGFEFEYGSRLGKSKPMSKDQTEEIPESKRNNDSVPLFVKCKSCDEYMDFANYIWKCPVCGKSVQEMTVYKQLDKENAEDDYEENWEVDDLEDL